MDVQIEKEQQSPVEYSIKVTVPPEVMADRVKTAINELAEKVQLPGFRPGHIPRKVIEQRFGQAALQDVMQDVLQEAYRSALDQAQIEPLSPGEMGDVHFHKDEPLTFTVKVEVAPEITLPPLSEISVELLQPAVDEEDVLRMLDELRESHAVITPVEEPVEADSIITMDLQELDTSGLPMIGRVQKSVPVDLSKAQLGEDFASKVVGLKEGDTAVVELPVHAHENEPKTKRFQVTITDVKRKELPPLNDELAKTVNPGLGSLEDLKNDLRRYLEARAGHAARERMFRAVADELLRRVEFPVPPRMLDDYLDRMAEDAVKGRKGKLDPHELEHFKEDYRASAIWSLRWYLLRKQLIAERGLEVTDDEVKSELERLAQVDGQSAKEFEKRLSAEQKERVREDLLERKVLALIESEVQTIPRPVTMAEFEGRTPSRIVTA